MPGKKPAYREKYPCEPGNEYCEQQNLPATYPITVAMHKRLQECGLTCTGLQAGILKGLGYCGIVGAVEERASDLAEPSYQQTFKRKGTLKLSDIVRAGACASHQIFNEGCDPADILQLPAPPLPVEHE